MTAAVLAEDDASAPRPGRRRFWQASAVVAIVAIAVLAAGSAWWAGSGRVPDDRSLDAGFARDMIVHHEQGVAMALLALERTSDPAIATLATDIMLTQNNQIGQMLGWLNVWGLPATGLEPPMAWMEPLSRTETSGMEGMDMAMGGAMPGMATPEELANLRGLSRDAFDAEFLRLMIRHHQGAIPMAEAALAGATSPAVRALARSIVASQQAEIAAMEALLGQQGQATPPRGG